MRLDDALKRADALFTGCLATALLDCEATLKNHGASSAEIRVETERLAAAWEAERFRVQQWVRSLYSAGAVQTR